MTATTWRIQNDHAFCKRTFASLILVGALAIPFVGTSLLSSTSAHADSLTSSWDADMSNSHSRATCVPGVGVNVKLPLNDPYGTVRSDYLYRWNGYQWINTGIAGRAVSNGALYFTSYAGRWLYLASTSLLAKTHGASIVYETVAQNGRVVSSGWYSAYAVGNYRSPDVAYCNV